MAECRVRQMIPVLQLVEIGSSDLRVNQEPMPSAQPYPAIQPAPTTPDVAAVILNWNAAADTLACAARLAEWQTIRPHLYIVDNDSEPTDRAALIAGLARLGAPYTLLRNATNQGFAGGTNRGLEAALQAGHDPLLLLNNDAQLDEAALGQLVTTLDASPNAGIVGPLLYHGDKILSAGNRNPATHIHTLIDTPPAAPVYPVDYVSGSVALIRPALLHAVGLLDERYFFNTEIADLCRRAQQAGYVTLVDQRARATHDLARSSALRTSLYTYYIVRNRLLYVQNAYHGLARHGLWAGWMFYSRLLALKLRLQGHATAATAVQLARLDAQAGRWGGQNERVLHACGLTPPPPTIAPAQS